MKKTLLAVAALSLSAAVALAADVPQQIDLGKIPGAAKVVDEVVVPVPTEIFGVLDKIGKPRWKDVLQPLGKTPVKPMGTREQTALLLGTVIAEGFIAVEAEDSEEVKNIGRSVLSLSEALNVRKVVVQRSNAIIQGADKKDWASVRKELDKAQHEVQQAMNQLNDGALSQLVSLGGWLRGTEALSEVVLQKFTADGAELLHQPVLAEFFERRLDHPKISGKPTVAKLREGLKEIRPLMGKSGADITEKSVTEIKSIAERLNKMVHSKNP
jgi:hypothetical protein